MSIKNYADSCKILMRRLSTTPSAYKGNGATGTLFIQFEVISQTGKKIQPPTRGLLILKAAAHEKDNTRKLNKQKASVECQRKILQGHETSIVYLSSSTICPWIHES